MMYLEPITLCHGSHVLARDLSLTLEEGTCTLLCGPNGSGKSTLLRLLSERWKAEAVFIPTGIPRQRGFTLRAFVRTACYRMSDRMGRMDRRQEARMDEALDWLGLSSLAGKDITTLSDGEFQKGCIAAAMTREARVLLLDEPTAFLDVDNRRMVLRTLQEMSRRTGAAVLLSSHDIDDALAVCDQVAAFTKTQGFMTFPVQDWGKFRIFDR